MALSWLIETVMHFPEFMQRKEKELKEEVQWRNHVMSCLFPWPDLGCPLRTWPQIKEHVRALMWYFVYVEIFFNVGIVPL